MTNVKWSDNVAFPVVGEVAGDFVMGLGGGGLANTKFAIGDFVLAASLATGIAAFLATPSSANLLSAMTTKTGTGLLVFGTSPTLTTPILGVATATSINKVTLTAPATGSTLTIADGKTLTASNTLTLTGTDGSSVAFGTGGTVAYVGGSQTFTGQQLTQDVTTTSPGWYAQITGDAVPRVRVGLNSTDVASLALGGGAGARDLFLERAGPANLRQGAPDAAAPVAQTNTVQNVVAGTSNTAGVNWTFGGSQGTGTAAGGSIVLQVAAGGTTGTSQNALATVLSINAGITGTPNNATLNSASFVLSGNISSAAWATNGLRHKGSAFSATDTTSSGTVAAAYTNLFGVATILASSATTYTNYFNTYFQDPVASTNVTMTNKWALGADTFKCAGVATIGSSLTLSATNNSILIGGRAVIDAGVGDGIVRFINNAVNGFTRIILGIETTNFPALGRSGKSLAVQLGDGSLSTGVGTLSAGNLRIGIDPSATPSANILTIGEASRGGTDTNTAGANGTVQSGLGTGSAAASKLIFQVPVVGSTGTTAQTYGTAVTVNNSTATGMQFNGYGAGALSTDASGNITATSARAAKEAFRDFDYGLETVKKINPQWWRWREETQLDRSREYGGFVADEIAGLIPELEGYGDPTRLVVAACVNAIKELERRIM